MPSKYLEKRTENEHFVFTYIYLAAKSEDEIRRKQYFRTEVLHPPFEYYVKWIKSCFFRFESDVCHYAEQMTNYNFNITNLEQCVEIVESKDKIGIRF